MTDQEWWCFAWYPSDFGKSRYRPCCALAAPSGALARWSPSHSSTAILGYDSESRMSCFLWTKGDLANLVFDFQDDIDSDIRISFQYDGCWSAVGKTCSQIPKPRPTMNFGWFTRNPNQATIQEVVLHEFGHALGLVHEHQHPKTAIRWNRPRVIADLSGPPNCWLTEEIEFNVFQPYSTSETNHTEEIDPDSIMMYPIPASWTLDGYSVSANSDLSQRDREFIHDQYRL